jgi:GxxExxY protein
MTGVPTAIELALNGLMLQLQAGLPLIDDGIRVPRAFRTDIVAGETVIPEIRSIEQIPPVHEARLLTYLRLSRCSVGSLLNFNTNLVKDGRRRFANTAAPRALGTPRPPCFMQAASRQGPSQCD